MVPKRVVSDMIRRVSQVCNESYVMRQYLLIISYLILIPLQCSAQQIIKFNVQSGTGFFVNRHDIITNAHVIDGCKDVVVKGAIPEHEATVKFIDKEHDLAVIETNMPPPQFAPLRYNIDDLKTGDKVMVIGYPGEAGARGEYKVAEARVEDIKFNNADNSKWLYITDVVEHGNSGGPVFDMSGNVIGVVVAKAVITTSNVETHQVIKQQTAGVVITLKTLQQFMFSNGIFSELVGSGVIFADSYIEQRARDYIVNVQCRIRVSSNAEFPED